MGQKHSGFTLIELSIVLVIIGLIVGGVLVGRDLIASAQVRAQITQFEQISAAVNAYRVKYNNLPGDDPNAITFGLGTVAGNGDGIIQLFYGSKPYEGIYAFRNMSTAGLVAGNYVDTDTNCVPGLSIPAPKLDYTPYPGNAWYSNIPVGFALFTATYAGYSNGAQFLGNGKIWIGSIAGSAAAGCRGSARGGFTSTVVRNIDAKVDDGSPFTGKVRLLGQDGLGEATSVQVMCDNNGADAWIGINCVYPGSVTYCATGVVGGVSNYTNLTTNFCPIGYQL